MAARDGQGGGGGLDKRGESDGHWRARAHGVNKQLELPALTFVYGAPDLPDASAASTPDLRSPEVVQPGAPTSGGDLEGLLWVARVPVCEVGDRRDRSVVES